jgi:hypothetical protein
MTSPNKEHREATRPAHELCAAELDTVTGGGMMKLMGQTLSNLANMRHESLKAIAQNLRG